MAKTKEREYHEQDFPAEIAKKVDRKVQARQEQGRSVWLGLGTMGMVGWTIAIFTLLGVMLGIWLEATWPNTLSWRLIGLIVGLVLGCLAAGFWVIQEMRAMQKPENNPQPGGQNNHV